MKKIAYLGPEGTFTELAATTFMDATETKYLPQKDIPSSLSALAKGDVDAAVVPLENTIEGSVNITVDSLVHKHNFPIAGEIAIPIAQHLLAHPSHEKHGQLEAVYSHPQAIAQCHDFLTEQYKDVEIIYANSTAQAAKEVSEDPTLKRMVIANKLAAKKYGLKVLAENIHDFANNHTRFVLLTAEEGSKEPYQKKFNGDVHKKTTIVVTLPTDFSGALHQVLSAFAWRKLNLSKIESRPMKTGIGNYFFIIDIDHDMDKVLIPGALEELKALGCTTRVLGSYPSMVIREEQGSEMKI